MAVALVGMSGWFRRQSSTSTNVASWQRTPMVVLPLSSRGLPRDFFARPDPAFALIAEKIAADVARLRAIEAQIDFDWEMVKRCSEACYAAIDVAWRLATTPPSTLEGIAAVLRFANQIEDEGCEWLDTDTIGSEGWHYQLRATMVAAIEAIIQIRQ